MQNLRLTKAMSGLVILTFFVICGQSLLSQAVDKKMAIKLTDEIVEEGKMIFNLEITSYTSTDLFLKDYKGDKGQVGGYFSYFSQSKNQFINVYYANNFDTELKNTTPPKVIFTTRYFLSDTSSQINVNNVKRENIEREMTDFEKKLFLMRQTTLNLISTDTLFQRFDNTSLNIIPMYYEGKYKTYVITVPQIEKVVVMGNDYAVNFDNNLKLKDKFKLHSDILPVDTGNDKNRGITYHTHNATTGGFVTPTDIAIMLLFAKNGGWLQHYILSNDWVTMWDVMKEKFTIKSKAEFDRENGK